MKIKQPLVFLSGVLLLGASFPGLTQEPSSQDKARLLEEKKQQIERLVKENDELKEQLSEYESTIVDYKSQIESLDQKIQERKAQDTGANEDHT
jgi:predicted nuclease with TOPRIM domain